MSILEIPGTYTDKMQSSPTRQSIFKYFRGLSRTQSTNDANRSEDDFYSQDFRQLLSFFDISYYTLVTPFRIAKSKDGTYKIETSILQQICVAVLNAFAVTVLIRQELNDFKGNVIQNPEIVFKNVKTVSRIFSFLIGIYIFWTKRSKLKKLVKISQNGGKKEQIPRIFITLVTLSLLVVWISDFSIKARYDFTSRIADYGRDINKLFNYGDSSFSSMNNSNSSLSFESKLLGSVYYFIDLYSGYIEELCELAILTIAFTVYRTCNGFHNLLRSKTQDITKISLHYRYVRKVTDLINDFVGPFLSVYIVGFMCYLLTSIISLFKMENRSSNPYAHFFYYGYLAKNFAILVIAAEANQKMHYLKEWLFQYKMEELYDRRMIRAAESSIKVKEESYKLLSLESSTTETGLGSPIFTITYGFLVMLLSIFATYTIIQLEFHKGGNSDMMGSNTFMAMPN